MKGIAILGLNGGGKSTLAHALSKAIDYYELDVEDCYFPEQSQSRKWSLENECIIDTEHLGPLPFTTPRSKEEVETEIMSTISENKKFIIAGVTMNWKEEILSRIDIAFWIDTPIEERLKRIQSREQKRFGSRVLEGGDMSSQQLEFLNVVREKSIQMIEDCIIKLDCPVIVIDGTLPMESNLKIMREHLNL